MQRVGQGEGIHRRRLLKQAAATTMGLAASSFIKPFNVIRAQGDEIVIGASLPMTGVAASWGKETYYAVQLVLDEVNAQGGIRSLGGRKLKLVVADHQNAPRLVVSETERLLARERVVALAGFATSTAGAVGREVVERRRVPTIDTGYADRLTEGKPKYYFRSSIRTSQLAEIGVGFVQAIGKATGVAPRRVVLLHEDGPFGTEAMDFAKQFVEATTDWQIAERITYSARDLSDAGPLVRRIQSLNPNVVFVSTQPSDGILIQRAINSLNLKVDAVVYLGGAPHTQDFINAMGKEADYVYVAIGFTPALYQKLKPECQALMDRYRKRWGIPINNHPAQALTMIAAIVDAIERAGSTDRDAVAEAIRQTDLRWQETPYLIAPYGVKFNERNDNERSGTFMTQIFDSVLWPVWPEAVKVREAVWPIPGWYRA